MVSGIGLVIGVDELSTDLSNFIGFSVSWTLKHVFSGISCKYLFLFGVSELIVSLHFLYVIGVSVNEDWTAFYSSSCGCVFSRLS